MKFGSGSKAEPECVESGDGLVGQRLIAHSTTGGLVFTPPDFGHVSEYSRPGRKRCHSSRVRFLLNRLQASVTRSFGCHRSLPTPFVSPTRRYVPEGSKPKSLLL